jgi:hypothetical protein
VVIEALEQLAADRERDDLPADFVAAFEERDGVALLLEDLGGREPGDARPDDAHPHATTSSVASTGTRARLIRPIERPKLQRISRPRIVVGTRMKACATMA